MLVNRFVVRFSSGKVESIWEYVITRRSYQSIARVKRQLRRLYPSTPIEVTRAVLPLPTVKKTLSKTALKKLYEDTGQELEGTRIDEIPEIQRFYIAPERKLLEGE